MCICATNWCTIKEALMVFPGTVGRSEPSKWVGPQTPSDKGNIFLTPF